MIDFIYSWFIVMLVVSAFALSLPVLFMGLEALVKHLFD